MMDNRIKKILNRIIPMIAVVASLISVIIATMEFTNLSMYREILLAVLASVIGVFVSFVFLKIVKQKREGNIFISYTHKDKKFVEKLVQSLKMKRFNIVYDDEIIKIGDNIKETIFSSIGKSDLMILVLSENSDSNDYLKLEMCHAIEQNKKILPIIIDSNTKVPNELLGVKYADFSKEYDNSLRQLVKSLIFLLEENNNN